MKISKCLAQCLSPSLCDKLENVFLNIDVVGAAVAMLGKNAETPQTLTGTLIFLGSIVLFYAVSFIHDKQ